MDNNKYPFQISALPLVIAHNIAMSINFDDLTFVDHSATRLFILVQGAAVFLIAIFLTSIVLLIIVVAVIVVTVIVLVLLTVLCISIVSNAYAFDITGSETVGVRVQLQALPVYPLSHEILVEALNSRRINPSLHVVPSFLEVRQGVHKHVKFGTVKLSLASALLLWLTGDAVDVLSTTTSATGDNSGGTSQGKRMD
jgi:hypothetical protein